MPDCTKCRLYPALRRRADQRFLAKATRASPRDHLWLCLYMREWERQVETWRNGQALPICLCQAVRERLRQATRITGIISGPVRTTDRQCQEALIEKPSKVPMAQGPQRSHGRENR